MAVCRKLYRIFSILFEKKVVYFGIDSQNSGFLKSSNESVTRRFIPVGKLKMEFHDIFL